MKDLRRPIGIWAGFAAVLVVLQHVSNRVLREPGYQLWMWHGLDRYLDGWSQFDGPEYLGIAENGYWYTPGVRSPIVWFPLYPNLVRAAHLVIDSWLLSGIAVAAVGGVAAVCVFWRWLAANGFEGRTQTTALLVLMTYPYGWYLYGVVHSDAVFLALIVGAFLLVQRDRFLLGGLLGALATATRPTGMAVIPALFVLGLERTGVLHAATDRWGVIGRLGLAVRFDRSRWRAANLAPLLSVVGLGAYAVYLGVRFGDPLAFKNNQLVYHPGDLPLLKRAFVVRWLRFGDNPTYALTILGQAVAAAIALLSVPTVARRLGLGYATFVIVLVAIPTFSTEDFMGTGRYLMAAFPVFAVLGEKLDASRWRSAVLAASALTMILLSMGFARSWYLT